MMQFPLSGRSQKSSLRQPKEIAVYSTNIDGVQTLGSRASMRYFYFPTTDVSSGAAAGDLNQGFSTFVQRDESVPKHLDELLKAVMWYEQNQNKGKRVKADIVTYRGVMTKLLTMPYARGEDVDINVVRFDGQLFMELDHGLLQMKKREMGERDKVMSYWGYKFEALATLGRPWAETSREEIEGRKDVVVDNVAEFCTVVRTGVGKTKVVLGAEVDCVSDYLPTDIDSNDIDGGDTAEPTDGGDNLSHYLELKTSRLITNPKTASTFELKLLKSWAQSFLIGVPAIVYGFRDDKGLVKALETFQTSEIPKLVFNSSMSSAAGGSSGTTSEKWNGNECVSFYSAVLDWLKTSVPDDEQQPVSPPTTAYRLSYKAHSDKLELVELTGSEGAQVAETVVLKEFVDWRVSRSA